MIKGILRWLSARREKKNDAYLALRAGREDYEEYWTRHESFRNPPERPAEPEIRLHPVLERP